MGRNIDLPYPLPDPTLTLTHGIMVPGCGWLYLWGSTESKSTDFFKGVFYFAATTAAVLVGINGAKKSQDGQVLSAFVFGIGLRWFDLKDSVGTALERREKRKYNGVGVD